MNGSPVWLASISKASPLRGGRLATPLWTPQTMQESWAWLRRLVGPAGDPSRERIFRMNVTVCMHRAATAEDLLRVAPWFHEAEPSDLAGGPVEVLWESEPGLPSTRPCHDPGRRPLDPTNRLLWLPLDCGRCPPCLARAEHDRRTDEAGIGPLYMSDLQVKALGGEL